MFNEFFTACLQPVEPLHAAMAWLLGVAHREKTLEISPPSRGYREGRVPDWNRQMSMRFWFKSLFILVVHLILVGQWSLSFWPRLCKKLIQKVVRLVNDFIQSIFAFLGSSGMLVIVAFQGPYNLSFDYPKESKGKLAFSSWLVTTQSWKCSVTAAYSSGAPVIAIFECQIRGTLTFYHERGQKHCKNLHKTAKSQHGWKTVCQKWVFNVDIPLTQTLPFLDPTM